MSFRVFEWIRNRNAAGRGRDPMPQIVHERVGPRLEVVARHELPESEADLSIDTLSRIYPAPQIDNLMG